MNIRFDAEKLTRLIKNLQDLTGVRTNTLDPDGRDIRLRADRSDFCALISASEEGRARCTNCDMRAVEKCRSMRRAYSYRCHARLCETVLPVYEGGMPVAYLIFGQLLSDEPVKQQWESTLEAVSWYTGDFEELHEAFIKLRRFSARERDAYAEILSALAEYIRQEGLIRSAEYTDGQKLEHYLDAHYMEELSLKRISSALGMGTTKLCAVAKELSGGKTLTKLIAERRVRAAEALLCKSDEPISAIAGQVGFNDYNYFTKIFKSVTGMTPREYRRSSRG